MSLDWKLPKDFNLNLVWKDETKDEVKAELYCLIFGTMTICHDLTGEMTDDKLKEIYKEIKKHKIEDIISIDETSIKGYMMTNYGKSPLGKRCKIKTDDNEIYKKYTFVSAITTKGTLGGTIYEKGGMDSNRFVVFLDKILSGVKNKLIVLDNGGMHKTEEVKNTLAIARLSVFASVFSSLLLLLVHK